MLICASHLLNNFEEEKNKHRTEKAGQREVSTRAKAVICPVADMKMGQEEGAQFQS